jgi:hypothetical protein
MAEKLSNESLLKLRAIADEIALFSRMNKTIWGEKYAGWRMMWGEWENGIKSIVDIEKGKS